MAGLPDELNFQKEEFAAQLPWIEPLIRRLNLFSSQVKNGLGALSVGGNVTGHIYSHTFTMPASGFTVFSFSVKFKPRLVLVGQCLKVDDPATKFSAAVFPSWQVIDKDGQTQVKVNLLSGLSASTKYAVTFLCLP